MAVLLSVGGCLAVLLSVGGCLVFYTSLAFDLRSLLWPADGIPKSVVTLCTKGQIVALYCQLI